MTNPDPATASDTPPPAVELRGLTHRYKNADRDAVSDVSLSVQPGESFALLGPNGGGKTTTFRILATLLQPSGQSSAMAKVLGHDVTQNPAAARQALGVVFQSPSLDPQLTARENLQCHARLYGISRRETAERSNELLERFRLADRADDRVAEFSGGMQRKLEIAKAMLHRPAVLLMDEPSTGLDPAARRDVWQLVDELRQTAGITCVWTTHLMDEAERADRVAIVSQGKLLAVDTPSNLRDTIGGQVVTVEPIDPIDLPTLRDRIEERFGPWQDNNRPVIVGAAVHFTQADTVGGDALFAALNDVMPQGTRRVSIGRPTLEEVFLRMTRNAEATATATGAAADVNDKQSPEALAVTAEPVHA